MRSVTMSPASGRQKSSTEILIQLTDQHVVNMFYEHMKQKCALHYLFRTAIHKDRWMHHWLCVLVSHLRVLIFNVTSDWTGT